MEADNGNVLVPLIPRGEEEVVLKETKEENQNFLFMTKRGQI